MFDYIVVGSGLCGSIIARHLAEKKNKKVLVLEKRNHIGGNVYDYVDESGIRVQKYGPHAFHTKKKEIWDYIRQFGEWKEYHLECMVYINGKYTPSPFNFKTIDDFFSKAEADEIKEHIKFVYGDSPKATIVEMLNSEDKVVKKYAQFLFDNDYSLYTAKQWGIKPNEIDVSVLKRVPVLFSYKTGYFDDQYQFMPMCGFAKIMDNILNHPNITIETNIDAKEMLSIDLEKHVIMYDNQEIPVVWTGAIDNLFDYKFGNLPYRSLRFEWKNASQKSYQEAPIVAYPQEKGYTRITEFTKLPYQDKGNKTTYAIEYPLPSSREALNEPYYPILTEESQEQNRRYQEEASKINNLYICGRLADFKYYNMDQAIEKALFICKTIEK